MSERAARNLLSIAREDLDAADKLLPTHPRGAGFHMQQAAEKALKSVLSAEGIAYPFTHRIAALAALLPAEHLWREPFESLDVLTEFATVQRYLLPGGDRPQPPTNLDLREKREVLDRLIERIEPWCTERSAGRG